MAAKKPGVRVLWRFVVLSGILGLTVVVHIVARDLVFRALLLGTAQKMLNQLASASVERVGKLSVDGDGNIVLHDVEITATGKGVKRMFYKAERAVLALDGWPLRDTNVRLARIDLFKPEIFIRKEMGGPWNLMWILKKAPDEVKPAEPPPSVPPPPAPPPVATGLPAPPPPPPADAFPFNGIHLHDASIHITIEAKSGRELTWSILKVHTRIVKDQTLRIGPVYGDFYGGRFIANAVLRSVKPFAIDARFTVIGADVDRIAQGSTILRRAISGKLDGVVSLTSDEGTNHRPLAAGQIEITKGRLYELPAFSGFIGILNLNLIPDRIVDAAQIMFTVERDHVAISQMDFLGSPISLFGDGVMTLSGDDLRLVMVPRLGRSYGDILSIITSPLKLLADVAMGSLVPVVVTGPFWAPKFEVAPKETISTKVSDLIEKKGGQPK